MNPFYIASSSFTSGENIHVDPVIQGVHEVQQSVKKNRISLRFLYLAMLIIISFCFSSKRADAQKDWNDNATNFNVNYDLNEEVLHIYSRMRFDSSGVINSWKCFTSYASINFDYNNGNRNNGFYIYYDTINNKIQVLWNGTDFYYVDTLSYPDPNNSNSVISEIRLQMYEENNRHITNVKISGNWQVQNFQIFGHTSTLISKTDETVSGTRASGVVFISPITTGTFKGFVETKKDGINEAKALIGYTKDAVNAADNIATMQPNLVYTDYDTGYVDLGSQSVKIKDSNYIDLSNREKDYYYSEIDKKYIIYDDNSPNINVPAFTLPKSASATYDSINHKVNFTWNIDTIFQGNYVKDNFKIQVADNPDFDNPQEITRTYNPSASSYTYTIDKNLSPHYYFRGARDHNDANWNIWDLGKAGEIFIPFRSLNTDSTSVALDSNVAIIKWFPDPTAWLPGASFTITRINNTTGVQTDIKLTEADFNKGIYTDAQIVTCNKYSYTLLVTPPLNSSFTANPAVKVKGDPLLPTNIGTVLNLITSKGYFPDHVELQWSSKGGFDNYIVKRAVYGSGNYVQIASLPGGGATSDYTTDDTKGTPGVYYDYEIIGAINCSGTTVYAKDTLHAIGFRNPTGNIHGRITYVNGQAVQNATVRVQSKDAIQTEQSVLLSGAAASYLKLDSLHTPLTDSAITVETWIRPTDAAPANQVIFSHGGQYELGFDGNGKLYFTYNNATVTGTYTNPNQSYVHVAGVHSKDSLILLLNGVVIGQTFFTYQKTTQIDSAVYIGKKKTGNNYKGYIDEMRVWNVAVSDSAIARNYTRLLTGGEAGLAAYWRFDETIPTQFYDLSYKSTEYNRNDGTVNGSTLRSPVYIPTADQLSFKDYTDANGNYLIAGIPYTGNGTTYSVAPLLGTHQFDPVSDTRLISASSTDFTVNFTDKSSFAVKGQIYYSNTNVPVQGVQFKVDGQYLQKSDGSLVVSMDDGSFTINVPVGVHKVQLVKSNHVFEQDGEILDNNNNPVNYQTDMVLNNPLYDTTTIRFIGRVAGGTVQQVYPLGYSLSANNLGTNLSVAMTLAGGGIYSLNTAPSGKTIIVPHLMPSDPKDTTKHYSRVDYLHDQIVIHPDSLTGEFAADIIPEKFNVASVTATGWGSLPQQAPVDFTNQFFVHTTGHTYMDSTRGKNSQQLDSGWIYHSYTDSVAYNDSALFIYRTSPAITIQQVGSSGTIPYFGDDTYTTQLLGGQSDVIPVIDVNKAGAGIYSLSYPLFTQSVPYQFKIKAFESYPFYIDNAKTIGTQDGNQRIEVVPTTDGQVSINNEFRAGSTGTDNVSFDPSGTAYYSFTAGDPDIGSDGLKSFSATLHYGAAGSVPWKSYDNTTKLQAYIAGGKITGNDFVTQGPNTMLMVLRDPPGSRSFTYAEKGTTISTTSTYSNSIDENGSLEVKASYAPSITTFVGAGIGAFFGVINDNTGPVVEGSIEGDEETHWTNSNTREQSITITDGYQTSDDPSFVGAGADVFVGTANNIIYGSSNNITVIDRDKESLLSGDIKLSDSTSRYVVVQRSGLNVGGSFPTLFAYTQQVIEYQMLPHLDSFIYAVLKKYPVNTDPALAQSYADQTDVPVYISHLQISDSRHYGKANNDPLAFGTDAKIKPYNDGDSYTIYYPAGSKLFNDTIMTLNQYIDGWKQALAANEKAKLESVLEQNYSFHAGSPISHSKQTEINYDTSYGFNWVVSGGLTASLGLTFDNVGVVTTLMIHAGHTTDSTHDNNTNNSTTMGFTLASNGTDDYFTVDEKKAPDGTFAFITKGGESACPYEGASFTKYYNPGTPLNQPTARIEVPKFDVDTHEVDNVPATRQAVFNLTLRNESEAGLPATFVLGYVDNNHIQGATIAVDGVSIGGGGRSIVVQYGQTVNKVLTITKGPNALNYDSIMIIWHSSCQYDPTSYQATIADTQIIAAHFIPSCSDVEIASPAANWILNTKSPLDSNNKRYLSVTIDKYDLTNSLFNHIDLQYKASADTGWQTAASFYKDTAGVQGARILITDPVSIRYNLEMNSAFFPDQSYDIQAVSYCTLGVGSPAITTLSNVITGLKDTLTPRLFGAPQPANGVLTASDNIEAVFNEPIAAGLINADSIQVTGIRNGSQGDHSVSIHLDGQNDYLTTEFAKSFTGKNITAELWMLPDASGKGGTLFSQGSAGNSMELALTSDHHLQVTISGKIISSDDLNYDPSGFAHVALVYNDVDKKVSAFYNFKEVIHAVSVLNGYNGLGHLEWGRSIGTGGNYFAGNIHEARLWTLAKTALDMQVNSLTSYSGAETGLLAYYPLNEGKGNIAYDKAHGSNAVITGDWSTPPGKAIAFGGNGYLRMNTSAEPVDTTMDYTIELWFKAASGQADAALASSGKGDGTERTDAKKVFFLGFENSLLTYRSNGITTQADGNYLDNNWHHVAVSVNRITGNAQLFVDGNLKKSFDAANVGGIAAPNVYLGVRAWNDPDSITVTNYDRYLTGSIDEFRIWNSYRNQTLINKNNNVRQSGNELGLKTYYPFEAYVTGSSTTSLDSSLQNMAKGDPVYAKDSNVVISDDKAPIKSLGPVSKLSFDYVVNNDALLINLMEQKQAIDKTIVTISVGQVRDLHGNVLASPVTWTAYINQNPLRWSDDELNISKDVNAPMQFQAYVVNTGGSVQHFKITNIPAWLTADVTGGTLDPQGKQVINFTVNERVNIGAYNEIINLLNDNNETAGLSINLTVKGKQPQWTVNPGDHKYNMNVYGKIRIDNIFSADSSDLIGAFINGKCVGVSHNTHNASNGLWYAFLTVYSDTIKYDNVEFRIWQSSTGKTYQAMPSIPVAFVNDAVAGTPGNPVIFDGKEMTYQNIDLNRGWNWISFNVANTSFNNINTALANGSWKSGDIVKNNEVGFDQYSTSSGWLGYLPGFNNTSMYMLSAGNAQTLSMLGSAIAADSLPVPLHGGRWNYISYLPGVNLSVKQALAGYNASDEDVIKSQTGFAMYDSQNGWIGNLSYLEPGKGYMLYRKRTPDTAFHYPVSALDGFRQASGSILNALETPVTSNYNYAENMTVTAVVGNEYAVQAGDVLLAYAGNEVRGQAQMITNAVINTGTLFFNIAGDNEQPVSFALQRNGKTIASSDAVFNYKTDEKVGTVSTPFIIHLKSSKELITAYPNPFSHNINIAVDLPAEQSSGTHEVQVSIHNSVGQLVLSRAKEMIYNGHYQMAWNGRKANGSDCAPGVYLINANIDGIVHVYKVIKQ